MSASTPESWSTYYWKTFVRCHPESQETLFIETSFSVEARTLEEARALVQEELSFLEAEHVRVSRFFDEHPASSYQGDELNEFNSYKPHEHEDVEHGAIRDLRARMDVQMADYQLDDYEHRIHNAHECRSSAPVCTDDGTLIGQTLSEYIATTVPQITPVRPRRVGFFFSTPRSPAEGAGGSGGGSAADSYSDEY